MRVSMSADQLRTAVTFIPGSDVSLFRALRELRRALYTAEVPEAFDPRRLLRAALFNGVEEPDAR